MSTAGGASGDAAGVEIVRAGPRDAIVVKPAGMSVEARGRDAVRALTGWAGGRWPARRIRLPHRLDRLARGFVVLAFDDEAIAFHAAMVAQRRWIKLYLARVRGDAERIGRLVGPHRLHLRRSGTRAEVVRSGGDPAITEILAVRPAPGRPNESHVAVRLHTGRYHQIRATLAHLGVPVRGDPIYDSPGTAGRGAAGAPWLEHALLVLPRLGEGDAEFCWRPADPRREPVEATLLAVLESTARRVTDDLRPR